MCCASAAFDPDFVRALTPDVWVEEEVESPDSSPDETTGVVPLSFKKLVQLGFLVAFGSDPASHHSLLVKPAQLSAALWQSPSH